MALVIKLSSCQPNDCKKLWLWDSTGVYNAVTNLTGYNAPNATSNSMTSAIINIYPPGYTVPIIFTFTIVTGTITACTRTDPDGTVTNVLADLSTTVFVFDTTEKLVFDSELLGLGDDLGMESGNWYFEYSVTNSTTTYVTSLDSWLFCLADCCVKKLLLKITPGNCGCENGSAGSIYREAKTFLDAASYAADWGLKEQAQNNLDEAMKICSSNCAGC